VLYVGCAGINQLARDADAPTFELNRFADLVLTVLSDGDFLVAECGVLAGAR